MCFPVVALVRLRKLSAGIFVADVRLDPGNPDSGECRTYLPWLASAASPVSARVERDGGPAEGQVGLVFAVASASGNTSDSSRARRPMARFSRLAVDMGSRGWR